MTSPQDTINGFLELLGSLAVLFHIRRILKDKRTAGMSAVPIVFFTIWGVWNLYYYSYLNQQLSCIAAGTVTLANLIYLTLIWKYRNAQST